MYASGYGTKQYSFDTREQAVEEMKKDAENTAAEYNGELQNYGEDEIVVIARDGDEIARFQMLD